MRRIAILVFAILLSAVSFAQTAEEIVSRMYSLLDSHDQSGLFLVLDIKIPILGTFTTDTWKVGDRIYSEAKVGNKRVVTYTDGESVWTYESDKNVIEIRSIAESDKRRTIPICSITSPKGMTSPSRAKPLQSGISSARSPKPTSVRTIPRQWIW